MRLLTPSYDGWAQQFQILRASGGWKIVVSSATSKCVDLAGGAIDNGTKLVINDCNGASSQSWAVTADVQTGAFVFKNVAAGRCLDENNWDTSPGVPMQVWDCGGGTNQKYYIQAVE